MKAGFFYVAVIISVFLVSGCIVKTNPLLDIENIISRGALNVSDLLSDPEYDSEVTVYGEVSLMGELLCTCFQLTSGGASITVWYDTMVEDNQTQRLPVNVIGIQNNDWVVVTGELKSAGTYRSEKDFWASSIEKLDS